MEMLSKEECVCGVLFPSQSVSCQSERGERQKDRQKALYTVCEHKQRPLETDVGESERKGYIGQGSLGTKPDFQ